MAKMTTLKMKERLEKELQAPNRQFSYNRDNDALTVVQSGKKVTLAIPQIIANYENDGDAAVEKLFIMWKRVFEQQREMLSWKIIKRTFILLCVQLLFLVKQKLEKYC